MRISILTMVVGFCLGAASPMLVSAAPVDVATARQVATAAVTERGQAEKQELLLAWEDGGRPLFFVFALEPIGFVVVSGDTDLPPVIAYSFRDEFPNVPQERGVLLGMLSVGIGHRLDNLPAMPTTVIEDRRRAWDRLRNPGPGSETKRGLQQWPPAGTTATGGWLEKNWHQNAPYNDQCPMDPVAGGRSVAGCPAVAVALILDYHQSINGTQLDDSDDYYHSFSGRQYWIDDDWAANGFPSFPTLSASLAELEGRYRSHTPATDADAAALVFACGVAATQVYTASISGTFGVNQAVDAYLRFGVDSLSLVPGTDPDIHQRMSENMKDGLPAHLAVVDPSGGAGHNLVIDGYNTDHYYHLNFGWGGTANGWYLIPDEIPYGLTEIDGVIVDIRLPIFSDGFESGSTSAWL